MTVLIESVSSITNLDRARILHSGLWASGGEASASSAATGYFIDGPTNSLTYEKWRPTSLPATWALDGFATTALDCAGIAAHTFGSTGCEIQFAVKVGGTWEIVIPYTLITTDDPIFILFTERAATGFRLEIRAGSSIPWIGVFKAGKALPLPVATYAGHIPDQFALETDLRTNQSDTGEFLGRSIQRRRTSPAYSWEHIPFSWLSLNMRSLQRGLEEEPLFIAWRPDGYNSVSFGYVNSIPQPQSMGILDFYSFGISMVGYRGAPT